MNKHKKDEKNENFEQVEKNANGNTFEINESEAKSKEAGKSGGNQNGNSFEINGEKDAG